MFVGHAALAFAIVGLGAYSIGLSRQQALSLAVVAALAGTVPDLDVLYALPTLVPGSGTGLLPVEAFWDGAAAHRSLTHSILVAGPMAVISGLVAARGPLRVAGMGLAVVAGAVLVGIQEGQIVVIAPFVVGVVGVGLIASRLSVPWQQAGLAAAVGLVSHPFGDLLTGDPPWMLYPAGLEVVSGRVTLAADPTMHLFAAFFFEIGALWLGLIALTTLRGLSLPSLIRPRAAFGTVFALAVFLIPAPTLGESYQFVFGVLAVGSLGIVPRDRRTPLSWVVTGLAAVTLAGLAFVLAYLLAG